MSSGRPPSRRYARPDVVANRHSLLLIAFTAVGSACLIFAASRLAVTLRTGLRTPWWGNAAGFVAIAALYAWYRRAPASRSTGAAHGIALVATLSLLLPIAYGMGSTIWWLSLVGFAMVLLGRPREAWIWGVTIPLIAATCVLVEPYVRLPGAAGEPFLEAALAKIVFVAILTGMSLGFRRAAEQRAQALYDSEEEVRRLKNEFEKRALTGEDLASRRLERLEHLNSVLRAVRNVSHLITREKDPQQLAEQACAMLVETRGYLGAWIGLARPDGSLAHWAEAIRGEAPAAFARLVEQGAWPPCQERAAGASGVVFVDAQTSCPSCSLSDRHVIRQAAVVALRHGGRSFGVLGISYPSDFAIDDEERGLLDEVADDLGYAFSGIETEGEQARVVALQRESEARFRQVFDTAPVPLSLFPLDGSSLTVNRRFVELFGYGVDELRTLDDWQLRAFPDPVYRSGVSEWSRTRFAAVSVDGGSVGPTERRVRCKDGRVLDGEMSGSRFGDTILVAFVDMTARKRAEEERRQAQATLAQSDRLANMGMLAAGVAHEINNPLAYVLYNLESLTRELPAQLEEVRRGPAEPSTRVEPPAAGAAPGGERPGAGPEVLADVLARLREALAGAQQIRTISRSLGTFSRVERTKMGPIDVKVSIEHALTMAHNEIKYRARIVKQFADVPMVLATSGKLAQVFLNLLLNAAHSIPEGSVDRHEVRVRTWAEGGRVCAEVSDTGEGIAPEHHARIFEPFFTTKGVGMGTGLGLSISRSIVEELGGEIGFTSELGKGTRFAVRLPSAPEDWDEPEEAAADVPRAAPVRGRILVVDDEDALRGVLRRMLGRHHDLVVVASGEEAKAVLVGDKDFDLLLFDMMMPRVSGMELHAWLHGQDAAVADRVVFMTGGAFTPASREYLAKVKNSCIEKPFDAAAFPGMVAQMVAAGRSARRPAG